MEANEFFRLFAREIAHELDRLRGVSAWVDQRDSPLGRNTHITAVRRRIAETPEGAEPDSAITPAGRYLMSPDALRDELRRGPRPSGVRHAKPKGPEDPPDSFATKLRDELRGLR